jgi:hypothetical protein
VPAWLAAQDQRPVFRVKVDMVVLNYRHRQQGALRQRPAGIFACSRTIAQKIATATQ